MTEPWLAVKMHKIQTYPGVFFCGLSTSGDQLLIGWYDRFVVVFSFTKKGEFLRETAYSLEQKIDFSNGLGPSVERQVFGEIENIMDALGFRSAGISVLPFESNRFGIGIKPLPIDLEDYRHDPSRFSTENARIFEADIQAWKEAGKGVRTLYY